MYYDTLTFLLVCNIVFSRLLQSLYLHQKPVFCNACSIYIFFKNDNLWYQMYVIFYILNPILHYTQKFCSLYPFEGKLFNTSKLLMKISTSYFDAFFIFILKYRQVYITVATLNTNKIVDFCSIPLKFHMLIDDKIKNMYTQNKWNIPLSCVLEAVHNRTFWRILVC